MILRFACMFLGALGLFAFYEIGIKEWFSWVTLAGSILFISHALNPKWSDRILMWFMNTVLNAGLEPIDQRVREWKYENGKWIPESEI